MAVTTSAEALTAWERLLLEQGKTAARTRESYRYVLFRIGKLINLTAPPEEITKFLQQHRQALQKGYEAGHISRSNIRLQVASIRSLYRTLVAAKLYPTDPTQTIRSIGSDEGVPRPLASQDVDKLFSAVDPATPEGLRDLCLLWLYYHSLRNTEVAQLTTDCVRYSAQDDSVVIRFKAKGGRTRTVVLVPEAGEALARHLLATFAHADVEDAATQNPPLSVFEALELLMTRTLKGQALPVFTHHNRPLTRRDSNRIFAKYKQKAGVVVAHPHMLRHTCATNLLNADVDLRTVQEILGHSSVRQTQRYTAVLTSRKQQAMNRLPRPAVTHG